MSRIQQMRAFVSNHKGEEFTASGLAKMLGWSKKQMVKVMGEDGTSTTDVARISHDAKAALRLARKCGAKVSRSEVNKSVGRFTITL